MKVDLNINKHYLAMFFALFFIFATVGLAQAGVGDWFNSITGAQVVETDTGLPPGYHTYICNEANTKCISYEALNTELEELAMKEGLWKIEGDELKYTGNTKIVGELDVVNDGEQPGKVIADFFKVGDSLSIYDNIIKADNAGSVLEFRNKNNAILATLSDAKGLDVTSEITAPKATIPTLASTTLTTRDVTATGKVTTNTFKVSDIVLGIDSSANHDFMRLKSGANDVGGIMFTERNTNWGVDDSLVLFSYDKRNIFLTSGDGSNSLYLMLDGSAKKVGIGTGAATAAPTHTLTVAGGLKSTGETILNNNLKVETNNIEVNNRYWGQGTYDTNNLETMPVCSDTATSPDYPVGDCCYTKDNGGDEAKQWCPGGMFVVGIHHDEHDNGEHDWTKLYCCKL
jgi:hypothetical protein